MHIRELQFGFCGGLTISVSCIFYRVFYIFHINVGATHDIMDYLISYKQMKGLHLFFYLFDTFFWAWQNFDNIVCFYFSGKTGSKLFQRISQSFLIKKRSSFKILSEIYTMASIVSFSISEWQSGHNESHWTLIFLLQIPKLFVQ